MSKSETIEFAPAVLRSLHILVPPGQTGPDLGCELGLSAWMRLTGTELEDASRHMWAVRQAVLDAGQMDAAIEPVPLAGRSPRLDLLNLVAYLSDLVVRAAAHQRCHPDVIVARSLDRPVLHRVGVTAPRVRQLRSS